MTTAFSWRCMEKIKVLYFINYPFRMTGANQVLFNLLQRRKKESAVVFMFHGPVFDFFSNNGIEVYNLDYRPKWIGSFGKKIFRIKTHQVITELIPEVLSLSHKLYSLLKSNRSLKNFRIIHFNDTRGLLTAGWFFKVSGYRVVTHIHGEFDVNNVRGMRWRLAKLLSDKFITVSNYLLQKMDDEGKSKSRNIYNGLDDNSGCNDVSAIVHIKKLQDRNITIFLKVASVVPFKGIHILIEAVRLLKAESRARLLFVIAGPAPDEYYAYQEFLKQQIDDYKLNDCFLFVGWQNDLSKFYNSCDALIHTSISSGMIRLGNQQIQIRGNEGLPTCILEAMRNGIPVVASRISGIPEQIQNYFNGILVEPDKPQDLAKAIEDFENSPAERLDCYKKNARALFLDRFQLSQFEASIEDVYNEVRH
jgi:glycosyltransferase involved in cell wall biosynthesis